MHNNKCLEETKNILSNLNTKYINAGLKLDEIEKVFVNNKLSNTQHFFYSSFIIKSTIIILLLCALYEYNVFHSIFNYILGIRCFVPNNYFVWEATRPVSNCQFCLNIKQPIILHNATKQEFAQYAYTSKPIVVKRAFLHWPAMKYFNLEFFKNLYNSIEDSHRSVDEECQFLHFKSDFISIKDVFSMSEARIQNLPGQKSWYVGWGNCHPHILEEMRRYYPKPHFLPEDCEIPSKEYVFMGYDDGATMHLDFINRLMWQAQLNGSKTWNLRPAPECEHICSSFSFRVEPGDAVLVDTRVWYHGTTITPGEFSLSVQSEYG